MTDDAQSRPPGPPAPDTEANPDEMRPLTTMLEHVLADILRDQQAQVKQVWDNGDGTVTIELDRTP